MAAPVRAAALRELIRRGDHLNWMISDAIIRVQQFEQGGNVELLDAAERRLRSAIARKPDEPAPWTILGEVYCRRDRAADAVAALERALACFEARKQPPGVRALCWLARSHLRGDDVESARAALARAQSELHRQSPPDAADQELIAETARRLDEKSAARAHE